jgi:nucleoid DNA-binding protein
MTKADLARAIYERHGGISNQEAQRIVDLVFTIMKKHLLNGGEIQIVGFGSLEVVRRRARRGRNPMTGNDIQLPERKVLVFRPSRVMKSI